MKKKTKITNLETRKELKSNKSVMDSMVKDISGSGAEITSLKGEIKSLNDQIKHLEDLLKKKSSEDGEKPIEEQIIMTELARLHDAHVIRNIPIVEKDDVKKLETLVKCLVSLRAGKVPKKKKEKSMSVEDAMAIMKESINE